MTDTLIAALHEHYRTVCDRLDPPASASREAMAEGVAGGPFGG